LRDFAFGSYWQANWLQALKLNFQYSSQCIIFLDGGNFNCHFNMGSLLLSDFKSNFFEIFESVIASDRENIFIQSIKLRIAAFSDDSKHVRIIIIWVMDGVFFEPNGYVNLFNRTREENIFAKGNVLLANFYKIFSFVKQLILRLFGTLFLRLARFLLLFLGWLLLFIYFKITH
jgi:hypothetical protein